MPVLAPVSEDAVKQVLRMLDEEFTRCRVIDEAIRETVVRRMLEEEDTITEAMGKYDVMELLSGGDMVQSVMAESPTLSVTIRVQLTTQQQSVLERNNPNVRFTFEPGSTMPHGLAFAQRVVYTTMCLRLLNRKCPVIDIGGNYASHKRAGRIVHSCTLRDSAREFHRQTERLATLFGEYGDVDNLDYCVSGVENCSKLADESMSIHVLPDIKWENWPLIMDKHGLDHHVAVFHYDPVILTACNGKLEGCEMFFSRNEREITFHFQEDSSLEYVHEWENYKKYLVPWCQVSDYSPYAYMYDIRSVGGGVCVGEIFRVKKTSLGRQVKKPYHAYVPRESLIRIKSVIFDVESNLDKTNPLAYQEIVVDVDQDTYDFMLMFGVSNDTINPDKYLDIKKFTDMMYVYNHTRKFGQLSISARRRIDGVDMPNVIAALFHVVVRERALFECKSRVYTKSLLERQGYKNINWSTLALMVPLIPLAAPLMVTGRGFSFYLDKFMLATKKYLAGAGAAFEVTKPPSYVQLSSPGLDNYSGYITGNKFSFSRRPLLLRAASSGSRNQEEFKQVLESISASASDTDTVKSLPVSSVFTYGVGVKEDSSPSVQEHASPESAVAEMEIPLERGFVELYKSYDKNGLTNTRHGDFYEDKDISSLHSNYVAMMQEYAMYSVECASDVLADLRTNSQYYVPQGIPHQMRMRGMNNALDVGAKVFEAVGGMFPLELTSYAIGIDPKSLRVFSIFQSPDSRAAYVKDVTIAMIYVQDSVKLFNQVVIAKSVQRSLKSGFYPTCPFTLVDGIPGCGKTHEIVSEYSVEDVVVCATAHACNLTLVRLLALDKFRGMNEELQRRVRTADSVSMRNGRPFSGVKTLFVDEGLMLFPGQLYHVTEIVRPESVRVFGDRFQIGSIDRSRTLGTLRFPRMQAWSTIELRNTSYSMPADVTALLDKYVYKRGIVTASPVRRSVSVVVKSSQDDRVYTAAKEGTTYLSVLRADKFKLLTGVGFVDGKRRMLQSIEGQELAPTLNSLVFSVHEAQGQRLDDVIVVRMNPNTCAVLDSVAHKVVAISRHYFSLCYATVSKEDSLYKLLTETVSEAMLDAASVPTPEWLAKKLERHA